VCWLNSFPANNVISATLSLRAIIVGSTIDYQHHCQLEFGTNVQTHEQHDSFMNTRTTGALDLRPTGNLQGGFYFYSLNTGCVLRHNHWMVLPMPGDVITHVHETARCNPANVSGLHILDCDTGIQMMQPLMERNPMHMTSIMMPMLLLMMTTIMTVPLLGHILIILMSVQGRTTTITTHIPVQRWTMTMADLMANLKMMHRQWIKMTTPTTSMTNTHSPNLTNLMIQSQRPKTITTWSQEIWTQNMEHAQERITSKPDINATAVTYTW
jgi:hypothetical protein